MRCRFRYGQRFAGELSALLFWHGKDLIGNLGVEALQTRKLLRLGLVKAQKRQLEGLGERCHGGIITYLASPCKIRENGGAPTIHPATQVAGFLAEGL